MSRPNMLLGLLIIAFVSACSTVPSTPALEVTLPLDLGPTVTFQVEQPSLEPGVTAAPTVPVLPAATSRGPNLEATDPASVLFASGGLQLVEFFRFT